MRFQLHSHVANFKALGLWNNLDEAGTTTHSHFKFSDSLFIQAVEPCLILEPLGSPQMRISVQNMSQHYQGNSKEYVRQRETIACKILPMLMPRYPHFTHHVFILISAIKTIRLCDEKNGGLLRTERTIRTIPCSLEALQLHTKKDLSASTSLNVFTSRSCKPDHSCLQKSSFSLHFCPIPFSLQKVSDRRHRDPSVIS